MEPRLRCAFVLALCAASQPIAAASFDCAKAQRPAERAICADAGLSDLDEQLARYYHGALAALQENAACLHGDQRDWLKHRDACAADTACLKRSYLDRLSELSALQPGINTRRALPLPPRPLLVWAMAPEADTIVAPAIASKPATVEGTLLYDDARNGFVLRAAPGRDFLLLPDIMRAGSNATMFPVLAEVNRGERLSARGRLAVKDEGHPYFDHRHCVFLYRLPR